MSGWNSALRFFSFKCQNADLQRRPASVPPALNLVPSLLTSGSLLRDELASMCGYPSFTSKSVQPQVRT